jgi:predicted membrane-bound spermidine synthase
MDHLAIHLPWWKKWLSYFFEFHIESAPSKYNPHLYVSLKNGRYQLCTAHAVYSFEDLYTNFFQAFQQLELDQREIKDVLVLGLGLGSIPHMLENNFQQNYRYTLVEIDENVIALAEKYCLSRLSSPTMTIQADAYAFVLQNRDQYDLICMDIFLDDVIPSQFESPAFLEALKSALSDHGLLLYNRLYRQKEDKQKTTAFFDGPFSVTFPDAQYLNVSGNWILRSK